MDLRNTQITSQKDRDVVPNIAVLQVPEVFTGHEGPRWSPLGVEPLQAVVAQEVSECSGKRLGAAGSALWPMVRWEAMGRLCGELFGSLSPGSNKSFLIVQTGQTMVISTRNLQRWLISMLIFQRSRCQSFCASCLIVGSCILMLRQMNPMCRKFPGLVHKYNDSVIPRSIWKLIIHRNSKRITVRRVSLGLSKKQPLKLLPYR